MDENTKALLTLYGVASVIGALTGLELSFTALSPAVIEGIFGSIAPALLAAYLICGKDPSKKEENLKPICVATIALASVAIGIGLAAATTAIFPGAMIGAGSAALTGAVIGVSTFIIGVSTTGYVIDPIVEKVSECFSSKEKGYELV